MKLQNCKAIIFDMDGVLWHSADVHAEAYKMALSNEGLTMPPYNELAGRRTDEAMRELLEMQTGNVDESQLIRLTEAKKELANSMLAKSPPVVQTCASTISALAQKYRMALASSGSTRNVNLFLNTCSVSHCFEFVLSGNDVNMAKPAPDIYLLALKMLGLQPEQCLVIEDSRSGIEAARRAGIPCIAITGTHTREFLENCPVEFVIDELNELCKHLNQ